MSIPPTQAEKVWVFAQNLDGTLSPATFGGGGGAVDSVNGQTGVVVLDAGDVGAVGLTGNETVAGIKTFTSSPIAPDVDGSDETLVPNVAYVNQVGTELFQYVDDHAVAFKQVTSLSSAQLLDLHNTPVTVVSAPGAGKMILPSYVAVVYNFNSIAYTVTDPDATFKFESSGGALDWALNLGLDGFITGTESTVNGTSAGGWDGGAPLADAENNSMTIAVEPGALEDGNGTVTVTVVYFIADV